MAASRILPAFVAVLSVAALVPFASAQAAGSPGIHNPSTPSPVTLYMHLIDIQDFPINTQKPDDRYTQSNAIGLLSSTTSCLPEDTPGARVSHQWHTFYGYSSPSYVEYSKETGGQPRVHPERGISYDAFLDPGTPFTLYWYMTTQSANAPDNLPADPDAVPVPVPNVVVSATIRSGDSITIDDRGYNNGDVLVQGKTEPATLFGDQVLPGAPGMVAPTHVKALSQLGDGRWLYEFAVPMAIEKPVIPRATGYNLRVDVAMDNPTCASDADKALMPNTVRIHSDAEHRPRMEFAITDPIRIQALHPQFVGDELVVHAGMNAAWGNYDVAEPSEYTPDVRPQDLQVSLEGPTPATSLALVNLVSKTNPHFMHQDDVTLVYLWPYKTDRALPGVYTVHLSVWNDQHTAQATADTTFEIGRAGQHSALNCTLGQECRNEGPAMEEKHGSPSLGPVAGLGALAAAVLVVRRRRDG